jgi:hypothetical protein
MSRITNQKECAHVWAAQTRESGRAANLYFEGATIYSYGAHYPVATFARPDVVLFNSEGSTKTTESKHKPAVRRALLGLGATVFTVPNVVSGLRANERESLSPEQHKDNLAHIVERYDCAITSASRSRKYASMYLDDARSREDDAIKYARTFGLKAPKLQRITQEMIDNAQETAARFAVEQRERDKQRKRSESL